MTKSESWVHTLANVREEERRALFLGAALSFFSLGSQYVIRPVRDAMGVAGQVRDLPRLFVFTLVGTLVLSPLVALLAARVSRQSLLRIFYRGIAMLLVAFVAFMAFAGANTLAARSFFVASSVLNLFVGSLAWSLLVDIFRREQGTRLFGLVAAGGTAGALAGSLIAATLAEFIGPRGLLVVAAAMLEGGAQVAGRLASRLGGAEAVAPRVGVFAQLRAVVTNRYLAGIALYMVLFTFTSTFAYLEQAQIVKRAVATTAERAALFARIDLSVNVLSATMQMLFAARLLRRIGPGLTLVILPLVTVAGFAWLRVAPTLAVIVVFQVVRRAIDYGIAKPARELLFTVVAPAEKYAAKNFVDTFVYRGGDASAAALFEAVAPALGTGVLAVTLPLCLGWAALSLVLGNASTRRSA